MSDGHALVPAPLNDRQLNLLARKFGACSGRSFVDVGCGEGQWLKALQVKGARVQGMDDPSRGAVALDGVILPGSPAANVPWESHSLDTVLLRSPQFFGAETFSAELIIALANLLSSLKPGGRLIVPVSSVDSLAAKSWQAEFRLLPGKAITRTVSTGLMGYLTLEFLFRPTAPVHLVEFRTMRQSPSRLEWHRIARAIVQSRMQSPVAA
ncbi:MAG: methyltransferase domain-containing protein [Planctomycetaceae bacterium]|nr:methyltransferase domain-containing protein [Planctomycetaceae bacterium]